jgi:cell division septation protein DedD
MKRWPLGFLLVIAISAHAQSFWDGNAAMQRGDAAFDTGPFALSSAFARDTEIVVENPATGKTTTVKVVGRVDDRLDILVLLSAAAAIPLGLGQGEIIQVRVTIRKVVAESAPILAEDTTPSADPDRVPSPVASPAAEEQPAAEVAQAVKTATPAQTVEVTEASKGSVPAESVTPATKPEVVEAAPVPETTVEEAVVEEPVVEEPVVEVATVEQTAAAEPTEAPGTEADALLAELAARSPQKQLHLPPREDEMFVYQEPVEPPTVEVAAVETVAEPVAEPVTETAVNVGPEAIESPTLTEATVQPAEPLVETLAQATMAEPEIASDPGLSAPESEVQPIALVEARPPAEIKPELVETLVAAAPAPLPEPKAALVEPGIAPTTTPEQPVTVAATEKPPAEKPPVTGGQATTTTTATTAPTTATPATATTPAAVKPPAVTVVLDLPAKGNLTWYLQLAAYSTETMARDTAARLSTTYPVLVLAPPAGTKPLYRVFVGPLNKAESGTLLAQFRYQGFPDAFVRTAQN